MTEVTIELPEQLAEQLKTYLAENPGDTVTEMIQEALRIRQVPRDISKLLSLAGVVQEAPRGCAEHAEDFED